MAELDIHGYPGPYATGKTITGIEDAEALGEDGREVLVFHAGTMISSEGELVTKGGRVLGVTALANDLEAARDLANIRRATQLFRTPSFAGNSLFLSSSDSAE